MARKNGKTTLLAGIALYMMVADGESGAEVYSVATKRDQAKLAWDEAARMVRRSATLKKFVSVYRNNLNVPRTDSKYEPLGADADTLDGLNVHFGAVDELHAHRNREVWDVMMTATGARTQPMILATTTAGKNVEGVCWQQNQYSQKVLEGIFNDDSHFAYVATIDEGDDWLDESVWKKANPNLGVCLKLDTLREEAAKAKAVPAEENAFRMRHLSQWVEQAERWIPMEAWNAIKRAIDPTELEGKVCYAGLDLSSTTDITALSLVFEGEDGEYPVLPEFWVPGDTIAERSKRDKVPYDVWKRQGIIHATDGNVIDYSAIRLRLSELSQVYKIKEIAYDRWGAAHLVQDLEEDGFTMVPFGQGYQSMSSPTKDLLKLVLEGKLIHGANPVLRWMASNAAVQRDAAENVKVVKDKSGDRVDGIIATIMALDRCTRHGEKKVSVLESRRKFTAL